MQGENITSGQPKKPRHIFQGLSDIVENIQERIDDCRKQLSKCILEMHVQPTEKLEQKILSLKDTIVFNEGMIERLINYWKKWIDHLKKICKRLERAKSTAECMVIIEYELTYILENYESMSSADELGELLPLYTNFLKARGEYYGRILEIEQAGDDSLTSSFDCQYPHTDEQVRAYNRIADIFEKQSFWSGSFSDFVFAMNEFAIKGYLTHVEHEEALANTFHVKVQGKQTPRKITAEQIKKRKRELENGNLSGKRASPEIRMEMETIFKDMPSNELNQK